METQDTIDWAQQEIRPVTSCADPALPGIFDIYQTSFPLVEQMQFSYFLHFLRDKQAGDAPERHLEVLAKDERVAGFVFYEIGDALPENQGRGGYLWYIASDPGIRGQGIGSRLYQHVFNRIISEFQCRCLLFEIEEYDDALAREGEEAARFSQWRRGWYRKFGARELHGVHYLCGVGWHPPIPMQIMVHAPLPLTPEEALALAHVVLDEGIEVVGPLALQ